MLYLKWFKLNTICEMFIPAFSSSLFPLFPFSASAANSCFLELQCYSSLMDSHSDFTARWLHISCILTHHSFSKLLNSSVKLMPFSLFGLISIRIWQYHMRLLWSEFPHIHTLLSHMYFTRGIILECFLHCSSPIAVWVSVPCRRALWLWWLIPHI